MAFHKRRLCGIVTLIALFAAFQALAGDDHRGEAIDKNHSASLDTLRANAERGDTDAQYELGEEYSKNIGTAKAMEWWHKAAQHGNPKAQYALGKAYDGGFGGIPRKDADEEAFKWMQKAADQGYGEAQYYLGVLYDRKGNDAESVKWWRKAAEQGHVPSEYKLGMAYFKGQGIAQDKAEAEKWLRKASVAAQNSGAHDGGGYTWLQRGVGVPQELADQVKALRKSAEAGDAKAQYDLGNAYFNIDDPLNEIGVPSVDTTESMKWWRKSAEHGNPEAQMALAEAYERGYAGVPGEVAKAQVIKWIRAAAEEGYADGQHSLGNIYYEGIGVPKDYVQAYVWYKLALAQDNRYADSSPITEILKIMTPDQIAEAKRVIGEWKPKPVD